MPPPVEDFYPRELRAIAGKSSEPLDLIRFRWEPAVLPVLQTSTDFARRPWAIARSETLSTLRAAFCDWAATEMSLRLDPEKEVYVGGSVSETIFTIASTFFDPGDLALCPNPGEPMYRQAIISLDAEPVGYHLTEKNNFKPRVKQFAEKLGRAAKALIISSPHSISGASLDADELDELLWMARRDNLLIVNDCSYQPVSDNSGPSSLAQPSGKKVCLEIYSLEMITGIEALPLTCVIGPKDLIAALKSATRVFGEKATETAALWAISAIREFPSTRIGSLRTRIRDAWVVAQKLCEGLEVALASPAPFVNALIRIPLRSSSQAFASTLLRKHGLLTLPAIAYGDLGEGYVRISLTGGPLVYQEALARLVDRDAQAG